MRNALFIVFFFILIVGFAPQLAVAQSDFNVNRIEQSISFKTVPKSPKAFEEVSITVASSAFDLNGATITWSVDGERVSAERGKKTLSFTTGALGSESRVSVEVASLTGEIIRRDLFFTPSDVALLWEADTYTPPFYNGKALFSNQSGLTIVAVPEFVMRDGRRLDANTLIYTWKEDGKIRGSLSGYGQRTFRVTGSVLGRRIKISVFVTTQDGRMQAEEVITVTPSEPVVAIYENSPLYGVLYNKALGGTFSMGDKETSFSAVPYFFSRGLQEQDLEFNWSVNGTPAGNKQSDSITLRNDEGTAGQSRLGLEVLNTGNSFQRALKNISILFNSQ